MRSDICCLEPGDADRRLPVRALASSRFNASGLRRLRSAASQADVVVAHGSSTLLACGAGLAGSGVPFVYVSIGDPRYWAGTALRRLRARWLIQRAAAVVAISPSARNVLIAHYGLPPERVQVIPNGRSGDVFTPADAARRAAARRQLALPATGDIVAVVGALSPEKRVDIAIAAMSRVPEATLVVAGDGPERHSLEAQAEASAPGRVHFLGATDGSVDVLAAADLVVVSSDTEGVPGILIEAGMAGLPVITTDVGWVRDVVLPGKTGLVVPPGRPGDLTDAIREALLKRHELGQTAHGHCLAEFEMAGVTDKWQQVLLDVSRVN